MILSNRKPLKPIMKKALKNTPPTSQSMFLSFKKA